MRHRLQMSELETFTISVVQPAHLERQKLEALGISKIYSYINASLEDDTGNINTEDVMVKCNFSHMNYYF